MTRLGGALVRFLRAPPVPRGLLLRALAVQWLVRAFLAMVSLRHVRRLLATAPARSPRSRPDRGAGDRQRERETVRRAIATTARFVPSSTCLVRALAAERLLARRGLASTLHLGVRRSSSGEPRIAAHAWLESGGDVVVGGHERGGYTPLVALGSGPRSEPAAAAADGEARALRLYGLEVGAPLELGAPEGDPGRAADFTLKRGARRSVPPRPPWGEMLAAHEVGSEAGYALASTEEGYRLRHFGWCEFDVDASLARSRFHVDPSTPEEYASILAAGNLVGALLALWGEPALHASAVEVDALDGAVAFVGASGAGKSTLAALCCQTGARLVTDDLLRLELSEEAPRCHPGGGEIRLRPKSEAILEGFEPRRVRRTADGRLGLRPPSVARDPVPIRRVLFPIPTRDADAVRGERLSRADALVALCRAGRLSGWRGAEVHRSRLRRFRTVAERVPAYRVRVPWGPPFPANVVPRILTATMPRPP